MSTWMTIDYYQWLNFAQFWLLPPVCVLCRRPGQRERDLCLACEAALPRPQSPCPTCALPLPPGAEGLGCGHCQTHDSIHATVAATRYADPVSTLVTRFKYGQGLECGRVLSSLLLDALRQRYRQHELPTLLLPVPLHSSRLRERGYNQSLLIAQDLGRALKIDVSATALQRRRATPPQQGLSALQRRRNLRGAFALADGCDLSAHRRIAVIDDVVTTMSTVHEIARVLRRNTEQPPEIHVWCLARA